MSTLTNNIGVLFARDDWSVFIQLVMRHWHDLFSNPEVGPWLLRMGTQWKPDCDAGNMVLQFERWAKEFAGVIESCETRTRIVLCDGFMKVLLDFEGYEQQKGNEVGAARVRDWICAWLRRFGASVTEETRTRVNALCPQGN